MTTTSFVWFFAYSGFTDFFGNSHTQTIDTLRTPSSSAYGEAFLNMPFKEDLTVADFMVQSPIEDYPELKVFLDSFFKDTEFHWHISIYSGNEDKSLIILYSREEWRFKDGRGIYENYFLPNYFSDEVLKVRLAFGEGVWVPGEEAKKFSQKVSSKGSEVI